MKKLIILALVFLFLFAAAAHATYVFPAFPKLPVFDRPIGIEDPLDGSDRLFVPERAGRIYAFQNDPTVTTRSLFLDIADSVTTLTEGGLLGLAFHPNYENNRFFYVTYTIDNPRREVLARFTANAANPNQAVRASELRLLVIPKENFYHNGGRIAFGPDGYLYWSLGEDGVAHYSQDLTKFNGKLLRIDVDNPSGGNSYGIPPGNPFAGNPNGYREEIWAYGFRNPWRFSFDVPTGRLWLGDVGQDTWEEVNLVKKGRNYGWPRMEGNDCFDPSTCDTAGLKIVLPLFVYPHNGGSASITGGFVYRGPSMPDLVGKYIYADFITDEISALSYDGVNPPVHSSLTSLFNVPSFGVDKDGELFMASFDGSIYRLFATPTTVQTPLAARALRIGPNPFQTATHISVNLSAPAQVEISVFDVAGRRVTTIMNAPAEKGMHTTNWSGRDGNGNPMGSGVYFVRLSLNGNATETRRVTLLK
jgi:glucose/arabinose dehydrogenase